MTDTVQVPRAVLDEAISCIEQALIGFGPCDHDANICLCGEKAALHALKLARGDADAIEKERHEQEMIDAARMAEEAYHTELDATHR